MNTLTEVARIALPGGAQLRVSRWTVDGAPGGVLVARGFPDDLDALRHDGGVLLPASALPELRTALEEAGDG